MKRPLLTDYQCIIRQKRNFCEEKARCKEVDCPVDVSKPENATLFDLLDFIDTAIADIDAKDPEDVEKTCIEINNLTNDIRSSLAMTVGGIGIGR